MITRLSKIIALVGPTASGKTELALALARQYHGIVISADSRQVYREMSIGTGKPKLARTDTFYDEPCFLLDGVRHIFFDIVSPEQIFTVAEYKDRVYAFLKRLQEKEPQTIPFLVGGTGLYVSAVLENWDIPRVAPTHLRESLEKRELSDLVRELESLTRDVMVPVDTKNKRRVIRALEVVLEGKHFDRTRGPKIFDSLILGIDIPREELYQRIDRRVDAMMSAGLVEEVKGLVAKYGWTARGLDGIGYRQFRSFLQDEVSLEEAVAALKQDTRHYAKRQLTWWRRRDVKWIKTIQAAYMLLQTFL